MRRRRCAREKQRLPTAYLQQNVGGSRHTAATDHGPRTCEHPSAPRVSDIELAERLAGGRKRPSPRDEEGERSSTRGTQQRHPGANHRAKYRTCDHNQRCNPFCRPAAYKLRPQPWWTSAIQRASPARATVLPLTC